MICHRCKKREATVHLTEIIHGEKGEKHLCEQCAAEDGITLKQPQLNELLANFVKSQSSATEVANITCQSCGMTFAEFRSGGLLGCPYDYDAFDKALTPLIKRAHENGAQHVGKVPQRAGVAQERQHDLMRARRELAAAVEREDYELAAKLRDQIKNLEKA